MFYIFLCFYKYALMSITFKIREAKKDLNIYFFSSFYFLRPLMCFTILIASPKSSSQDWPLRHAICAVTQCPILRKTLLAVPDFFVSVFKFLTFF